MTQTDLRIERQLAHVFAPLDKRALGLAFGTVCALVLALLTIGALVVDPTHRFPLQLLSEYFYGYTVSLPGAFIGALWAFVTGFCWGWFLAFSRNLVLAVWLMSLRVRSDLAASRSFLDHI